MQSTKQAVFMLGQEEYALDINDVRTIEDFIPVESVANLPKNIKGIIKLRGDIIPVYSLRRKFGLDDIPATVESRYIITNSNDMAIAYEVDEMTEIIEVEGEQMYEVPSILKSKNTAFIKSIANYKGQLVAVLNHDGILTQEEQDKIKTVIKK